MPVAGGTLEKRSQASAEQFEVRFMQNMIDHHAMAVMMAEMCQARAVHPELEAMCQEIEQAQAAEIEQMQTWLQSWYGISYEPSMKTSGQMKQLAEATGQEFEIMFMEMMIKHHEAAIREASKCTERAIHEPLIELCHEIKAVQTAEIEQMQTWLCSWYGECR